MSTSQAFNTGQGHNGRQSHRPPVSETKFTVQAAQTQLPTYPPQPIPPANGPAPFRFDLSSLLTAADLATIQNSGIMAFHTVGDTGDHRGQQMDFVAQMMTQDAASDPDGLTPAFFYHLGDVVYFAGDIDMYGDNFYETYKDYPGFIVAIAGNHDCQPDDPQDGPVDPNKYPLDGFVANFMSKTPTLPGSMKTGTGRTQMDLPNVYWTFTTPVVTIIGLFSNVGEGEAYFDTPQMAWFKSELAAADPNLPLIVAVHHPPYSGDTEHSGSSVCEQMLFGNFQTTGRYADLILSGHVHNYQRFTNVVQTAGGQRAIPCVVAGAGGYTNLGRLQKINGNYPDPNSPLDLGNGLTLDKYDQTNFGFLRLEVSKAAIKGTYFSAPYTAGSSTPGAVYDTFTIDLAAHTVS
jgi:calcineurin-like phosphoesterase family protein